MTTPEVAPKPPPEYTQNGVADDADTTEEHKTEQTPAAVSPKKPHNLNDLSPEMQANITNHIHRKSDLKSLCLVSKRFYDVAVKDLYRVVEFDIRRQEMTLSGLVDHQNKGLKYIRNFRVCYEARNGDPSESDQTHAHAVVRLIVNALPENSLEDFEWSPWFPFSRSTYLHLIHKQKRLKWLTAFRLDEAGAIRDLEAKADENVELFKGCHKLSVYPDCIATLELGHYYLTKFSKLTDLIVHTNFRHVGSLHSTREVNDGPTGPGLITKTLFKNWLPFDKCKPFTHLKSLTLSDISLRHCADTWICLIDFTQVEILRVGRCPGADALLTMLCKSKSLPRQLKTLELQHEDNLENDALASLDGFLCIVEGLRELYIDLSNVKSLPEVEGIIKHGRTLEVLFVHACDQITQDEHVWSPEDFQRICVNSTNIQQLSCAWPTGSILRSTSPIFDSYSFSIRALHKLVTLHISTFPTCSPLKTPLDRKTYTTLLRNIATILFSSIPQMPTSTLCLRLIAFGASDKIPSRQDSANQVIYLKSTCVNAEGKEEKMAAQVGWGVRKGIEPRSEVLDFEAVRKVKMPVREFTTFIDDEDDEDDIG